jgi:GntR family transcriptional regulator
MNRKQADAKLKTRNASGDGVWAEFFTTHRGPEIPGIPKYVQFRETLLAAIRNGTLPPGTRIPPESHLARETPFSLGTIQKALKDLADRGYLLRRQGLGTFVADAVSQMEVPWHCRFTSDMEGEFLAVYPKVVARKVSTIEAEWARILNPDTCEVIQIDRVMDIGHEFYVYIRFYLNKERFSNFLKLNTQELERYNFKTILYRKYNLTITHMTYTLMISAFSPDICRSIRIPDNSIGAIYSVVAGCGKNSPVYYQEIFIPPNPRKLHISDSSNIPEYWP